MVCGHFFWGDMRLIYDLHYGIRPARNKSYRFSPRKNRPSSPEWARADQGSITLLHVDLGLLDNHYGTEIFGKSVKRRNRNNTVVCRNGVLSMSKS